MPRRCRLARTDFCALALLLACGLGGAQAADQAPAVIPPKPVVLPPTAMMAPPPSVPEAADSGASPAAKVAKAHKPANTGKPKPKKPAAKPKGRQR